MEWTLKRQEMERWRQDQRNGIILDLESLFDVWTAYKLSRNEGPVAWSPENQSLDGKGKCEIMSVKYDRTRYDWKRWMKNGWEMSSKD